MIKHVMSAASLMICLSFFFTACKKDINDQSLTGVQSENAVAENSLLKRAHVTQASPLIIYTNADCYNVYNGGYGSAIATAPGQGSDAFYLMTDRGSNVNGPVSDSKTFILPSFSPQIALFKIIGDSAVKQSVIILKDGQGNPLTVCRILAARAAAVKRRMILMAISWLPIRTVLMQKVLLP